MYVRWKRKRLTRCWRKTMGDSLSAVLVRSERVDGRPRQRYVRHLGAIPEQQIGTYGWALDFWHSVDASLTALELLPDERERLAGQVATRVPRPVKDDGPGLAELERVIARGRR